MSGAGDLLGTLGAVAPSALAGYTRGQTRALQYQAQQQQLHQQLLLRQLAQHLQEQQYTEQQRHNKATEAQAEAQLKATQAEKTATGLDAHRKYLTEIAYGPGADERLYGMHQAGVLPAFYGMLQEAGVPVPAGSYLPAETRTVTTPQPDRVQTTQGPPLPVPGFGVPGEGPFGIPPLQAPGAVTTTRTPQPPKTTQERLPARVEGATFPKPARVQAEEALAGYRTQQTDKAATDNLLLALTFDDRLREAVGKGDLATAQARWEELKPGIEERRAKAAESTANSLAGYRSGMLGESAKNRASREQQEAANRASHETIAANALAVQKELLPERLKHLKALTARAQKALEGDFNPAEKDELKVLDKQLFATQSVQQGLQRHTEYLEPPAVREAALRRKLEIWGAHGYQPPEMAGGAGSAGPATTPAAGASQTFTKQELNVAGRLLDMGDRAIKAQMDAYGNNPAGKAALQGAIAEVRRRRAGKKTK